MTREEHLRQLIGPDPIEREIPPIWKERWLVLATVVYFVLALSSIVAMWFRK